MVQLALYKEQYKKTLRLAAPVMLSQVGVSAVQLFDNAMVGQLGALPLAAVSFGGSVFFMVFIFTTGLALGLTPLVGEQYARGRGEEAARYFQNSFVLFGAAGLAAFGVLHALVPLMYHMGQPREVVDMAVPYYRWLVWSILPYMVFCCFKQFLEGVGNTTVNMVIIVTANLINIFCNWLFIYGHWGCPRMGAEGAGFATFISRVCMPVFALAVFVWAPRFKAYLLYFRARHFCWRHQRSLLRMGAPIALQMLMEGAAFALTSIMMGWISTTVIAGNQIAMTVSNFAFMILVGLSSATTIRISHEYGRADWAELRRAANASYHLGLMWNAFTALLFITLREPIARIFTSDAEAVQVAAHLLVFVAAFQFSDGLQSITIGILRGIQDVKRIMLVAFLSYIVINLPMGYLLAFTLGLGPGGLWMGFILGLSMAAVQLITRFRRQYRRLAERGSM